MLIAIKLLKQDSTLNLLFLNGLQIYPKITNASGYKIKMNLRLALWLLMDYFISVGINVGEGKCLTIKIVKRLHMPQIIISFCISNDEFLV